MASIHVRCLHISVNCLHKPNANCECYTFKIEVLVRDTKRDEADAQAGLLKIWNDGAVGMIGSSSSNPTSAMTTIAGIDNINLAIVGFHAGSPTLSNMKKYPTFLRVNPIITDSIRAIMRLLQRTFCAFQPTYCC